MRLFFGFRGRLSRKGWWLAQAVVLSVASAGHYVFGKLDLPSPSAELWGFAFLLSALAITIKRLNDRAHPTWVREALVIMVLAVALARQYGHLLDPLKSGGVEPALFVAGGIAALWLLIDAGFLRGTPGPNRYGPDPVPRSRFPVPRSGPDHSPPLVAVDFRAGLLLAALLLATWMGLAPTFGLSNPVLGMVGRLVLPEAMSLQMDREANKPAQQAHMAGLTARAAGDDDAAIMQFSRAIELYGPDKAVAAQSYRTRASALDGTGKLREALADYDKALDLEPDHSWALRGRARVLSALGRHADALKDFEAALRIGPSSASAQLGRGDVLADLERPNEALDAYAQVVSAAANDYAAFSSIARSDISRMRSRAGRDQMIALAHIRRGNVYRKLGQHDPAAVEYAEALRVWPNHWSAYVNRGWLYEGQGRIELARADYEKAATLKAPNDWLKKAIERTR